MKKKLFSILLSLAMVVTMMPAMTMTASAAEMVTVTVDLCGGTLLSGTPSGWTDNADQTYSKRFEKYTTVDLSEEWKGYEPVSGDSIFADWVDDNGWSASYYWQIDSDKTVKAKFCNPVYLTLDLRGGTLSGEPPTGWTDNGDGTYKKGYPGNKLAYFGDEWEGLDPASADSVFNGWVKSDGYDTYGSIYISDDPVTVYAKYCPFLNVIVDLKGGSVSTESVPEGWTVVTGEPDKYTKRYPAEMSNAYSIKDEWSDVVPIYPEASGVAFIEWEIKDSWYYLENDNSIIQAKVGELVYVTFDPDGGTVLSADSSWTLTADGKYVKKYPKGTALYSIQGEISSSFKIASRKGDYFFTNTFTCNSSFNVEDNTVYKPNFVQGYTLTIAAPVNGYILVNGEKITSSKEFFVPSDINISPNNGVLTIDAYAHPDLMEPITIEGYGNSGYELDSYTISGGAITGSVYSIDSDKTISATFKNGTQNYPVWVDGEQFSADNLSMMNGTVSYNPDTQTLVLDGANISSSKACAINFANFLNIYVRSDSVLSSTGRTRCVIAGIPYSNSLSDYDIIKSNVNLNITGEGNLIVEYDDSTVSSQSFNSVGIFAKNITLNTDVDISSGSMSALSLASLYYYGIKAEKTIVNNSALKIETGALEDTGSMYCSPIEGALVMNQADVMINLENVQIDHISSRKFVSDKLTLNSGKFSGSINPAGFSVTLSQAAALKEISGAQDGATSSDLQFTQKEANVPLVLLTEDTPEPTPPTPTPGPTPTEEYTVPVESENTVQVEATIESGKAAVKEITKEVIEEVTKPAAGKEKADAIVIDLSKAKQEVTAVELTAKTVENFAEAVASKDNAVEKVTIQMAEATVELDAKTLEAVSKEANGDTIKLVVDKTQEEQLKDAQKEALSNYNVKKTFEAYFESNGQRISDFKGGKVVLKIKFTPENGKNSNKYKVWYVGEDGKIEKYASKYENGFLIFTTTHFSDYAIVYDTSVDVLLLKAKTSGNKAIKLSWNGIDNASMYVIYGARCGNKYRKLKTTTNKSYTVKKISGKKLVPHKHYKFYVVAYDTLGNKVKSRKIHFVAANTVGKYANVKSIKAKFNELLLSVGVTQKISATYKMYSGKKHIPKSYGPALKYFSNNPDVATVSSTGKVKAVGKGTATIYIQDIGGKYCKTKVTVE